MRVYQLLSTVGAGAMTDYDAFSIARMLRDMGFQNGIYGERLHKHLPEGAALPLHKLPKPAADDVIVYHKSAGSFLSVPLEQFSCRKLMIFHGETPPRYWKAYSAQRHAAAEQSMQELCRLADAVDYCMVDTAYHETVLRELNYRCPVVVRPPLIPFSDYAQTPDAAVLAKYEGDGIVNFLTTGELVPNRRLENVLRVFSCYQRYCNPKSRLLIVGGFDQTEQYCRQLKRYARALELERVVFTGKTTFPERLAYYRTANLFLSMSEQEDFSLPLVEAMYFGVPVVAYRTSAVPDTMGDSGLLLPTADPMEAALAADRLLKSPDLRREVAASQRRRQQQLAFGEIRRLFEKQFRDFLDIVPAPEKKKMLAFHR